MKVLCISKNINGNIEDRYLDIIPGKYYDAQPYGISHYLVLDESGQECIYLIENFESPEVARERKLNDLGI